MAKTPQVGEQAPDFELAGTDGPFQLSEHRGERVVLLFYPGDNTMVCTKQFCSYRDRAEDFAALTPPSSASPRRTSPRTRGSSPSTASTCRCWPTSTRRSPRPTARYSPRLGTKRAVIVIDEQGIVRHRHDHLLGLDYQSVDELKEALGAIRAWRE